MPQDNTTAHHAKITEMLRPAINQSGKVDIEKLRALHPTLASVLSEFAASKTSRDDPEAVAKDLSRTVEARSPGSRLANALTKLEGELKHG